LRADPALTLGAAERQERAPCRSLRRPLAVGLVQPAAGTPTPDRIWARAVVVRYARDAHLQLIDVLELDDDGARTRAMLSRLSELAAASTPCASWWPASPTSGP
jgi:hypothetical protein